MSTLSKSQFITYIVAAITVIFSFFELLVAGGYITIAQGQGFLSNLTQGGSQWYLNPITWVLVLVVVVNFFGFAENYARGAQTWDIKKFAETWLKYLPIVVFFSQVPWANLIPNLNPSLVAQTNIGITSAIALAIDIITRAVKSLSSKSATSTVTASTPVAQPSPGLPPALPATVVISGSQKVTMVRVDGATYSASSTGSIAAGQWTSQPDSANNRTIVAIAFADYNLHTVQIFYGTTFWQGSLKSGSVFP